VNCHIEGPDQCSCKKIDPNRGRFCLDGCGNPAGVYSFNGNKVWAERQHVLLQVKMQEAILKSMHRKSLKSHLSSFTLPAKTDNNTALETTIDQADAPEEEEEERV
jgi:hypothetical protein